MAGTSPGSGARSTRSAGRLIPPARPRWRSCARRSSKPVGHGRHDQRADARVREDPEPVAHDVGRPAQRDGVDQGVGQRGGGLVAAPARGSGPAPRGRRPRTRSPTRGGCRSSSRASPSRPTYSARKGRSTSRAAAQVLVDDHVHGRRDVEALGGRAAARAKPSSSSGRNAATCSGEKRIGQPAVGDLGRERGVARPDRGEVDGDALLHRARSSASAPCPARRGAAARASGRGTRAARAAAPCAPPRRSRASAASCRPKRWPCHPSATCGPLEPMPSSIRPPDSWSSVAAVIAVIAGERPGICMIAVPEPDPLRLPGQPGEDGHRVRPVGLGRPHGVVAEPLGLLHQLELLPGRQPEPPVADVHPEPHGAGARLAAGQPRPFAEVVDEPQQAQRGERLGEEEVGAGLLSPAPSPARRPSP